MAIGSGWRDHPETVGKFGKGEVNENGEHLIEFCENNDLCITNTLFKHKLAHITTWTSPFRNTYKDKNGDTIPLNGNDGKPRRNPFRNQIDFIITKIKHKVLFQDSRSYGGCKTDSDHKLVKAQLQLEWHKIFRKSKQSNEKNNINVINFAYEDK